MLLLAAARLAIASLPVAPPSQTEISAPGPSGALAGTFIRAPGTQARQAPVVLIIPGSGPTDRDGNSPMGVSAAPYRLLAEGLAAQGVSTVRIDKRGMFGSRGAVPSANDTTIDDYVRDTRAWIEVIRSTTGVNCVWVAGHSEGGSVALATAAQHEQPNHICGLVLIAAAGRPLGDVIKAQLHANPANAPLLEAADKAVDALQAGQRVEAATLPPALGPLFRPEVQGFLISAMAIDPVKLIARVRVPVLILQGTRDIQVGVDDAQRLKRADALATLKLLPDTNHVLKQVSSDNVGANVATYADPNLPLAPGVVEAIAQFVKPPS